MQQPHLVLSLALALGVLAPLGSGVLAADPPAAAAAPAAAQAPAAAPAFTLAPLPYDAKSPTQISFGTGVYHDKYAFALGFYHYTREHVLWNIAISATQNSERMGRLGVTIRIK